MAMMVVEMAEIKQIIWVGLKKEITNIEDVLSKMIPLYIYKSYQNNTEIKNPNHSNENIKEIKTIRIYKYPEHNKICILFDIGNCFKDIHLFD